MANHPADGLIYLSIPLRQDWEQLLAPIRHWSNLTVTLEKDGIFIHGFSPEQAGSLEVRTMPYHTLYRAKEDKLFPEGSLLPVRDIPAKEGWPMANALPLGLPWFNRNFFGLHDSPRIEIKLVPAKEERPAAALIVGLQALSSWIETAPAVRLQPLQWAVIDEEKAFIFGQPLLPLPGEAFWQKSDHLLPLGLDFELPVLEGALSRLLNPGSGHWLVWQRDGSYCRVGRLALKGLSIGSFRKTQMTSLKDDIF